MNDLSKNDSGFSEVFSSTVHCLSGSDFEIDSSISIRKVEEFTPHNTADYPDIYTLTSLDENDKGKYEKDHKYRLFGIF